MRDNKFKFFYIAFVGYALIAFAANAQSIVIKNATIYDGLNNTPFVGNILIDENKIKKISSSNLQADFVIDASEKIVTPGFIATDTQLGIVEIGALSVTRDDSSKMYKIGFSIFNAFNPNSTLIPWNRSNGITSALTLPNNTSSPIGGLGSYFVLDSKLDVTGTSDMVMIGEFGGSSSKSRAEQFSMIEDLLILASSLTKSDINSDLELSDLIDEWSISDAMNLHPRDMRALYQLVNNNLPLIIKSHRASDLLKLIELKEKYNLNIIIMGAQEASLVSDELAEHNIPLIFDPMNNIPESFDELASNIQMASKLEEAGIEMMFTVSRSHNYHLIRQGAGVAVANGLSYGAAIRALSSTPAKVFGIKDRGTIESGKIADLIIWEADPLEPSSMPEYVFVNGENIDLTTRSSRLRDRYTKKLNKPVIYRD
ncbi:MAG: amidohydrolase [Gammaproteobacteria bacterium]|nr:amidohydrolase [Gammaproteobacteria bacterium]|tara:strand:- start:1109 stop:2389 length:1281 start_codon:yes stop_codon:yes gene_type:complete